MEANANCNALNARAQGALMAAAGANSVPCVRLLLDKGADATAVDHAGVSVVSVVANLGNVDMMRSVLEKGGNTARGGTGRGAARQSARRQAACLTPPLYHP